MPPPEVVGIRENLMLLINNHIFKMAAMLKPTAEYNHRAAIIEGLRAWELSNGNNSILWISEINHL